MRQRTSSERAGRLIRCASGADAYQAFLPKALPPDPPLEYNRAIRALDEEANRALGRLDAAVSFIPDAELFLYSYVRKEAILSSQIEGTQSTLVELLELEVTPRARPPNDEVQEVSNYVAAIQHGLKRLRQDGFPLSLRLIRETHDILLRSGRGARRNPGEFRRSQNWLGGTGPADAQYVPPPPDQVMPCLDAMENYIHEEDDVPLLIKTGLVHAQFETIHPFLDGNGRVGRLLVTLMLCAKGVLSEPLHYLSLYLKQRRLEYYERLSAIRFEGDWERWIEFYLEGVLEVSRSAAETAQRITALFQEHRDALDGFGRASSTLLRLHRLLCRVPVVTARQGAQELGVTAPTVQRAIDIFRQQGWLNEVTGRSRGRVYAYTPYLRILTEGLEERPG